jgi:hypothetical protein
MMKSACCWLALSIGVWVGQLPAQLATTGHESSDAVTLDGSFKAKISEGQNLEARGDYSGAEYFFANLSRGAETHDSGV